MRRAIVIEDNEHPARDIDQAMSCFHQAVVQPHGHVFVLKVEIAQSRGHDLTLES
jgi:hypothetical protein